MKPFLFADLSDNGNFALKGVRQKLVRTLVEYETPIIIIHQGFNYQDELVNIYVPGYKSYEIEYVWKYDLDNFIEEETVNHPDEFTTEEKALLYFKEHYLKAVRSAYEQDNKP